MNRQNKQGNNKKQTKTFSVDLIRVNLHLYKRSPSFWIALYQPVIQTFEWHELGVCRPWSRSLFPRLSTTDLQLLVENLSHTTKAPQEGRKSLNFILSHPLLPWKLVGGNVQLCSYLITPPTTNQNPPLIPTSPNDKFNLWSSQLVDSSSLWLWVSVYEYQLTPTQWNIWKLQYLCHWKKL